MRHKKFQAGKQKSSRRRLLWCLPALVGLGLVVMLVLELTNTTYIFHKRPAYVTIPSKATNTTAAATPNSSSSKSTTTTSTSSASTPAPASVDKTYSQPTASPTTLVLGTAQTFVSNHKPGQDGASTAEQSACNTTPGATCYIQFTQGDLTRSLETKTADNNGTVIWNWDTKGANFSSGSWQITAVAALGGQTKSAHDQLALEIP